ncbi:MAG: hypothetical protein M3Z08_05275 [Chloroflexota bacterium]|nr:hypothetical protein [Chloroflexota bacterium]
MKRSLFAVLGIASLLLTLGFFTTPHAYAATANQEISNDCPVYDYGSSSDATLRNFATPPMWTFEDDNAPSLGTVFDPCLKTLELEWTNKGADFYQVITTVNGQSNQVSYSGSFQQNPSNGDLLVDLSNTPYNVQYTYQVESCNRNWYGSNCTDWSPHVTIFTGPQGLCIQGFVWRGANSNDHVCVTLNVRDQAAYDNSQASSRVDPHGAYGPDTCIQGYTWRGAFSGDHVCVTPDVRTQAAYDNSQAPYRIVS